jgi:hypothetical protein
MIAGIDDYELWIDLHGHQSRTVSNLLTVTRLEEQLEALVRSALYQMDEETALDVLEIISEMGDDA